MTDESKEKFEAALDAIELNLNKKKELWNNTIHELAGRLKNKNPQELTDLQADTISHKQRLIDEMSEYAVKLAKDISSKKQLYKKHFEGYKTDYQIKTGVGELTKLIESDLAMHERKLNIYEAYILYLKDTGSNLEQINYGIKNKISLINYFGID